jgi:GTP-binding protein Era
VILRFLDPTRVYGDEDIRIDDVLRTLSVPILRIQTKGDMPKGFPHADVDMHINSMNKKGFPELIHLISRYLPVGPYLYSPDYYTDQPMDLRISEVIRQVLFTELGEELPYACYIEVASIEEKASIIPTK